MKILSVRVLSFVFWLLCFDVIAMSMLESDSRPIQGVESIILLKELGDSLLWAPQTTKSADSTFDRSVTISGVKYPVFLSDDLERKLTINDDESRGLLQKLKERLQEIQQRDYSKFPINISNFSLYLSDDKKDVYSMAFSENDW